MNQDNKGFIENFKLSEAFWTGLFVCAAAILLWLGYSYISGSSSEEGFNIKVKFENVYGLEKGNEIIFSGLVIGQVDNVGTLGGAKSGGLNPIVTLKIEEMFERLNTEALNFQQLYYAERKHLIYLDKQNCSINEQNNKILEA